MRVIDKEMIIEGTGKERVRGFMPKANQVPIPYFDPNVQHVGISRLRALNVTHCASWTRHW